MVGSRSIHYSWFASHKKATDRPTVAYTLLCYFNNNVSIQYNGGLLPDIILVPGRVEGRRGRRGQTSPGEERGNETGKVAIAHGSVEFCEATPIGLADES